MDCSQIIVESSFTFNVSKETSFVKKKKKLNKLFIQHFNVTEASLLAAIGTYCIGMPCVYKITLRIRLYIIKNVSTRHAMT